MASNENNIFLSPTRTCIKHEDNLVSGTAKPGMILVYSGAGVAANTSADAVAPLLMVADLAVATAGAIGTEYNTTDNNRVNWQVPQSGEIVRLFVGASTTISKGDQLGTNTGGAVKKVAVADVGVIAYALEAVTVGAGTSGFVKAIVK